MSSRAKTLNFLVCSAFSPIGTGENAYSDEVLQIGLDFVMVVCFNSRTGQV